MKTIKYILPLFLALFIFSCSDDDNDVTKVDEVADLLKVQEITNDTHSIELFTDSGKLWQGYNDITIRIKDKTTEEYIENATVTWKPVMHMITMMHSCPKSEILKVSDKETIYNGYIVFQMAENADEGWDLTFNYTIDGASYEAKGDISVPMSTKKVVTSFMGSDEKRYVVALISPQNPEVKVNDIEMGVYTMENMMSFPMVTNYKVKLDPRMPSMGNHSSPNNEDLTYEASNKMYQGKLSLTMTGYWKLNLMLLNPENETLKGNAVTEEVESSDLYLEIEF
jgi:hypothetical protein